MSFSKVFINTTIAFNSSRFHSTAFLKNPFQPGVYKIVFRQEGLLTVESMYGNTASFKKEFVAEQYFYKNWYFTHVIQSVKSPSLELFAVKDELLDLYEASLPFYVKEGDYIWFLNASPSFVPSTLNAHFQMN